MTEYGFQKKSKGRIVHTPSCVNTIQTEYGENSRENLDNSQKLQNAKPLFSHLNHLVLSRTQGNNVAEELDHF